MFKYFQTKKRLSRFFSALFLLISAVFFGSVFFLSCGKQEVSQSYFPQTGDAAIYHRALEVNSNLNVLSIALEPGYEDLKALAYFRLAKGANILSAYQTNGEAGESDIRDEYPNYLAATRRLEAGEALAHLGGDVHFLNFPHIVAARDSGKIREKWLKNETVAKIIDLINLFKPDIILIARDWEWGEESLRWQILKDDILSAVEQNKTWQVGRVLGGNQIAGKKLPVDNNHPHFGKKYREIGSEAAQKYQSISLQRTSWMKNSPEAYSILYPASKSNLTELESQLPIRNSIRLWSTARKIRNLTDKILEKNKELLVRNLVSILDSVNIKIASRFNLSERDQKTLFQWKEGLEQLQCSILGINVKYSLDHQLLVKRQIAYIEVDELDGFEPDENSSIYFGGLNKKWAVNEGFEKKFRIRLGERYRLLTPEDVPITNPQAKFGLQLARLDKPISFFVLHQSPIKEKSFIHHSEVRLKFAPKVTTEILTPIVRIVAGEKLIVRLANHSRDGVADTLRVIDDMVESTLGRFRMSQKGTSYLDTLTLIWKKFPADGSYRIPLEIGGMNVGFFGARMFETRINEEKKVGVITGLVGSSVLVTLKRLGFNYVEVDPDKDLSGQIQDLDALILDKRVLTLKSKVKEKSGVFNKFVDNGGHLIVFTQDPQEWKNSNIWKEIQLTPSFKFDENYPLRIDPNHPFLTEPNKINTDDFADWLFLRGYNKIQFSDVNNITSPVTTEGGEWPLVVTRTRGEGRLTYIDLALHHQFLNVHIGALRFLANVLSI